MLTIQQITSAVGVSSVTDAMKKLSVEFINGNYKLNGKLYKNFDEAMNEAINLPGNKHYADAILIESEKINENLKMLLQEGRYLEVPAGVLRSYASDNIALTTSYKFLSKNVIEELGVVSVDHVYGLNVIKDIFAVFSDFFGGRSNTVESAISNSKETAINELKLQALLKGGNGIVGLSMTTSVNDGKLSMLKVSAIGTVVKYK